jgi:threonine/homoserine/homoserine lactone efflux protein
MTITPDQLALFAAAILGLGVIAATHAGLLAALKYAGAAWLLWIGITSDLMTYAWVASRARNYVANSHTARRIDRVSGGVLCGAGAAIAAS